MAKWYKNGSGQWFNVDLYRKLFVSEAAIYAQIGESAHQIDTFKVNHDAQYMLDAIITNTTHTIQRDQMCFKEIK